MYKCKIINGGGYSSFEISLNNIFEALPPSAELVSIQHLTGTSGRLHDGYGYGELKCQNSILVVWKE